MKTTLGNVLTFIGSVAIGCGAAIAIAAAAAVTHEAPTLRPCAVRTVPQIAPKDVIRLDPVVVTISKSGYDAMRKEVMSDTEVAGTNASRKVTHG